MELQNKLRLLSSYCVLSYYLMLILLPCVYCCTVCVLLSYSNYLPNCWLEVSIRKVLRPANSEQGFLGFRVSKTEC